MDVIQNVDSGALVYINQGGYQALAPASKITGPLSKAGFSTILTFDQNKEVYFNATGLSPIFTLQTSPPGVNGIGIILRLNKPTAITFPASFIALSGDTFDATKLNIYYLSYVSDWDGLGNAKVEYVLKTTTAN